MRLLDLFAGIGGFSLAAHWMGWETAAFVERDRFCQRVLRKNFGANIEIHDDIREFSGKPFRGRCDIVTGGFPCQPFSRAGQRKGIADDRYLWPEMFRIIQETRPAWIVGENTPDIKKMVLDRIYDDLESCGYATQAFDIPAGAVGAKQYRYRTWIISHSGQERCRTEEKESVFTRRAAVELRSGWSVEPAVGRVAYGIPGQLDRGRGLGNSIVPQIAYEIFRAINAATGR